MDLENRFTVAVPLDVAWSGLLDIPLVVECLPGASLTETVDATTYKGCVRVRIGPMAMEFAGQLQVESIDEAAHQARIRATWNETRNRGSATSLSVLEAAAGFAQTDVCVKTSVTLAGQIAQYGRGVGVIQAVSAELVRQFASNLQAALATRQTRQAPIASSPPESPERSQTLSTMPAEALAQTPADRQIDTRKEISSLTLLWAAFTTWLRGLFAAR